jgi:hypothetical protein
MINNTDLLDSVIDIVIDSMTPMTLIEGEAVITQGYTYIYRHIY